MAFEFVEAGNIDSNARKLIRSHVMKGKNVGKTRPGPPRREKQSLISSGVRTSGLEIPIACKMNAQCLVSVPENVGNELSFFTFPCEMQPHMRDSIHRSMAIANQHVYPTEFCLPFEDGKSIWFQYLVSDEAFFHSVLAMSEAQRSSLGGMQETSPQLLQHLSNTYQCIRRHLQKHVTPSDAIIASVMSMAIHEDLKGQPSRSKIHLDALERMIELRGGMARFEFKTALVQKICRADIEYALQFGSYPRFNRDEFPVALIRRSMLAQSISQKEILGTADDIHLYDPELRRAFVDLLSVSRLLNRGHTLFRLNPFAYQEILISILYRLLHKFPLAGSRLNNDQNNACQLGLLSTMSTLFFQYSRSERLSYDLIAMRLRYAIDNAPRDVQNELQFLLWLLFIGGISVFGPSDEAWLYNLIKTCLSDLNINSWSAARDTIKRFSWIDKAHDKPGQDLWQAVHMK